MLADINVASAATGDYFLHLSTVGATLGFFDKIWVETNGSSGYYLGTSIGGSGTGVYNTTTSLAFGQVYHVVAEYDFRPGATDDTCELYLNPTDPTYGGGTPWASQTNTTSIPEPTGLSSVNMRQGTTGSGQG